MTSEELRNRMAQNFPYRYLSVSSESETLRVTLKPPFDFRGGPLGGKRLKTAKMWFSRFATKHSAQLSRQGDELYFSLSLRKSRSELLEQLDQRMSIAFDGPVSARTVQVVLRINKAELSRWLSDGRLPSSGRQKVGTGGQSFSVPVYDAELIANLERHPSTIEEWRTADRLHPHCGGSV